MDSLTQITLGAAVGEIILGKKLGNRAMLWGAIGGTIPDLDVIARACMTEIEALAVHRGFSHSIFFAVFVSVPIAWLVFKLYQAGIYKKPWYRAIVSLLNALVLILIVSGFLRLAIVRPGMTTWLFALFVAIGSGYLGYRLYTSYFKVPPEDIRIGYPKWYALFFWAFLTHIGLDCFTAFGTQVFQPFSDYRVAFNTISVVDPLYTVPLLICLTCASMLHRERPLRKRLNLAGLTLSSIYLIFTIWNKWRVDQVFGKAIEERALPVLRYRTSPTILNNVLWNCVAESETHFYMGLYSIFDSDPHLHHLNMIPKKHDLLEPIADQREIQILEWFSNGYFAIEQINAETLLLSDLRYGGFQDEIEDRSRDLVFNFYIRRDGESLEVYQSRTRPENVSEAVLQLWTRIQGY